MADINKFVEGLLGSPAFNMGVGLLSAGGRRPGPRVSFGQALGEASQYANAMTRQANRLQIERQAIKDQKNRQSAIKGIQGLLGPQPPASIAAPAGLQQQRMMGLLAQAAPEQFASQMIQSQFAQPRALPREAALAQQMFPGEPLETSVPKVVAMMNPQNPQDALDTQKTLLEIQKLMADLRSGQQEQEQAEEQEQIQTGVNQNSIDTSISTIGGIAQNLNKIKGTMLQPGAPAPNFRRLASGALSFGREMLGLDSSKQQELNTALDLVNKDLNGLILDTIQNFGGNLTVQQTRILEEASANENITPQAIASVLEVALNARKFAAQNDPNLTLSNQDQIDAIESLLQEIKTFGGGNNTLDWSELPGAQ